MDESDIERDQLEYIKRNMEIETKPPVQFISLTKDQELKVVNEISEKIPYSKTINTKDTSFTVTRYLHILSDSFVDIIDDLLNFNGDIETLPDIFIKNDRMIFLGTVIIILAILFLIKQK